MGQSVAIKTATVVGEVLVVDTDRSFTGQDGESMTRDEPGTAVPGRIAAALFAVDPVIDHVHVLGNTVTARRPGGWVEETAAEVRSVVEGLLRFY